MVDIQKKYNTSSIIISHDLSCVRITANRIVMLIDGRNYAEGTYQELSNSEDELVKNFYI
jgi:phospholipid/cholesterol/gamma-HCH transport system ATP-binding protein